MTTSNAAETTGPILDDPRLRKLSFTGSTDVGKRLAAEAAHHVLRVSMELGEMPRSWYSVTPTWTRRSTAR